jgi:hypothetical protein
MDFDIKKYTNEIELLLYQSLKNINEDTVENEDSLLLIKYILNENISNNLDIDYTKIFTFDKKPIMLFNFLVNHKNKFIKKIINDGIDKININFIENLKYINKKTLSLHFSNVIDFIIRSDNNNFINFVVNCKILNYNKLFNYLYSTKKYSELNILLFDNKIMNTIVFWNMLSKKYISFFDCEVNFITRIIRDLENINSILTIKNEDKHFMENILSLVDILIKNDDTYSIQLIIKKIQLSSNNNDSIKESVIEHSIEYGKSNIIKQWLCKNIDNNIFPKYPTTGNELFHITSIINKDCIMSKYITKNINCHSYLSVIRPILKKFKHLWIESLDYTDSLDNNIISIISRVRDIQTIDMVKKFINYCLLNKVKLNKIFTHELLTGSARWSNFNVFQYIIKKFYETSKINNDMEYYDKTIKMEMSRDIDIDILSASCFNNDIRVLEFIINNKNIYFESLNIVFNIDVIKAIFSNMQNNKFKLKQLRLINKIYPLDVHCHRILSNISSNSNEIDFILEILKIIGSINNNASLKYIFENYSINNIHTIFNSIHIDIDKINLFDILIDLGYNKLWCSDSVIYLVEYINKKKIEYFENCQDDVYYEKNNPYDIKFYKDKDKLIRYLLRYSSNNIKLHDAIRKEFTLNGIIVDENNDSYNLFIKKLIRELIMYLKSIDVNFDSVGYAENYIIGNKTIIKYAYVNFENRKNALLFEELMLCGINHISLLNVHITKEIPLKWIKARYYLNHFAFKKWYNNKKIFKEKIFDVNSEVKMIPPNTCKLIPYGGIEYINKLNTLEHFMEYEISINKWMKHSKRPKHIMPYELISVMNNLSNYLITPKADGIYKIIEIDEYKIESEYINKNNLYLAFNIISNDSKKLFKNINKLIEIHPYRKMIVDNINNFIDNGFNIESIFEFIKIDTKILNLYLNEYNCGLKWYPKFIFDCTSMDLSIFSKILELDSNDLQLLYNTDGWIINEKIDSEVTLFKNNKLPNIYKYKFIRDMTIDLLYKNNKWYSSDNTEYNVLTTNDNLKNDNIYRCYWDNNQWHQKEERYDKIKPNNDYIINIVQNLIKYKWRVADLIKFTNINNNNFYYHKHINKYNMSPYILKFLKLQTNIYKHVIDLIFDSHVYNSYRILDIGGGRGKISKHINKYGNHIEYYCMDIDCDILTNSIYNKNINKLWIDMNDNWFNPKETVKYIDINNIILNKVNIIIMNYSITYSINLDTLLEKINSISDKNTLLMISLLDIDDLIPKMNNNKFDLNDQGYIKLIDENDDFVNVCIKYSWVHNKQINERIPKINYLIEKCNNDNWVVKNIISPKSFNLENQYGTDKRMLNFQESHKWIIFNKFIMNK